jgi:hypothetical protein
MNEPEISSSNTPYNTVLVDCASEGSIPVFGRRGVIVGIGVTIRAGGARMTGILGMLTITAGVGIVTITGAVTTGTTTPLLAIIGATPQLPS